LIPLYVEEAWHYTPSALKREDSVYKLGWFQPQEEWHQIDLAQDMQMLDPLKESVLKILEEARQKQLAPLLYDLTSRFVGNALQADLIISAPHPSQAEHFLKEYGISLFRLG